MDGGETGFTVTPWVCAADQEMSGLPLWEQGEAQAWAGRSRGTMSFTHQQGRGSSAAGIAAGRSGIQAVSHSQPCSQADVQVKVQRFGGVHCLGRRRALGLTISRKPCLWPLCLRAWAGVRRSRRRDSSCGAVPRPFSKSRSMFPVLLAHPLQQLPTGTEESTSIMQQFSPPSVFGFFSTFFFYLEYNRIVQLEGIYTRAVIRSSRDQQREQWMHSKQMQSLTRVAKENE